MPKRVDENQRDIVAALRKVGANVQDLHTVGHGCPDILVGYRGRLYLLEVKSTNGKLTPDELVWHRAWMYLPVYVVRSVAEALQVIGAEVYA